ncbi:complex I assembly factor ACAD9, mitochondrial-like [Contarinia nasturtii]|uniref:complex I assembly factor ACAD9, mitochondrial-like n=1 Tax=Contarinia nasturtii TaxID=265458 RepID=UPI0012D3DE77|nr:complex I assembly factor ACAD9, mitochondrial-like [Contarinia nasturtii]
MLRTGVFRLSRTINFHSYRPISTSLWLANTNAAQKSFPNVDDLFGKVGKPVEPLIENPIIVKKFFISEIDSEQMLYPEVLSKDELDAIRKRNENVSEYFRSSIDYDEKGISKTVHDSFKQMGIYGYNVPKEFGGMGFIHTETILCSEIEGKKINVGMILKAHRLVCEAINEYGTNEQRSKYLPKLASGDLIATPASQEWTRDDIAATTSTAEYDADKKQWRLNGTKSFVINAAKSNLFMVSAQVPQSKKTDSLSIFLVDANLPGVSVHKKDNTIGLRNLYQADVSFKDVYLESDAILSTPGSGRHIERTTMFLSRLQQSALNLIQMKSINQFMVDMIEPVEDSNRINNPEGTSFESASLRSEVLKSAADIYSTESMLYMTAGLMDLYKNTNIDVETAIIKTFSQDRLLSMALALSNFVEAPVTLDEHPMNNVIRDALQLQTFGEPKDILKLYIGVAGIQHSGDRIFDSVKKKRNPFLHPELALQSFYKEETMDKYESNLNLMENVLAVFDIHARWVEASIQRLRIGSSNLMETYGRNLFTQHQEIQRLSETVTYIYASFASLVRANRSVILRLPHAEFEHTLAGCSCDMNTQKVKELMEHIESGPLHPIDKHYQTIAKQVIKNKSYYPVHPLTRFI